MYLVYGSTNTEESHTRSRCLAQCLNQHWFQTKENTSELQGRQDLRARHYSQPCQTVVLLPHTTTRLPAALTTSSRRPLLLLSVDTCTPSVPQLNADQIVAQLVHIASLPLVHLRGPVVDVRDQAVSLRVLDGDARRDATRQHHGPDQSPFLRSGGIQSTPPSASNNKHQRCANQGARGQITIHNESTQNHSSTI